MIVPLLLLLLASPQVRQTNTNTLRRCMCQQSRSGTVAVPWGPAAPPAAGLPLASGRCLRVGDQHQSASDPFLPQASWEQRPRVDRHAIQLATLHLASYRRPPGRPRPRLAPPSTSRLWGCHLSFTRPSAVATCQAQTSGWLGGTVRTCRTQWWAAGTVSAQRLGVAPQPLHPNSAMLQTATSLLSLEP